MDRSGLQTPPGASRTTAADPRQLSDVVSPEGAAELLSFVPHARYVDVEATGHMVAGDDNDVFTAELTEFLDGLPAPDRGRRRDRDLGEFEVAVPGGVT